MFIVNPYMLGAGGGISNSLDFDGASYLSMSDANFGTSTTRTKFAVAFAFKVDTFATNSNQGIVMRGDFPFVASTCEFRIAIVSSALRVTFWNNDGTTASNFISTTTISAGTWYHVLIHYDSANATSTDRIKMWINGAAETASSYTWNGTQPDKNKQMVIGAYNSSTELDGLLYQLTYFDNTLPSTSDVFDGSNKLKNLTGVSGAYSLLDAVTAVNDYFLSTDWTNTSGVTTSATVP